jgi:hypothetical protein
MATGCGCSHWPINGVVGLVDNEGCTGEPQADASTCGECLPPGYGEWLPSGQRSQVLLLLRGASSAAEELDEASWSSTSPTRTPLIALTLLGPRKYATKDRIAPNAKRPVRTTHPETPLSTAAAEAMIRLRSINVFVQVAVVVAVVSVEASLEVVLALDSRPPPRRPSLTTKTELVLGRRGPGVVPSKPPSKPPSSPAPATPTETPMAACSPGVNLS